MKTKVLGEFDIYINDGNYGNIYPEKSQFLDSGIPFISATDFKGRVFNYEGIKYINRDLHFKVLTKGHLKINDVIIVVRGNGIGKVGFFKDEIGECNMNAQLAFIRTNPKELNSAFLYYLFSSEEYLKLIRKFGSGSAQPQLPINRLKLVPVVCKEIHVQNKIAKVLSDLDNKIEVNNKINQELEAMAETLYDYWFVQFDFPTSEAQAKQIGNLSLVGKPYKSSGGKMVFNKELKREIPEGWEVMMLSGFSDCNKWNRTKESIYDKINYLDTSSLTENVIESIQELDFERDKIPSRAQRIVSENDILYSTVRPNQLHYGIIKRPIENLIASTGFAQIRSNNSKITNDFIYQILSQDYVSTRLQQIAVGSVSAYPSISHNDIMDLKIALPLDEKLIKKGTEIFQQCNEKVALNLEENQKLSELRDWLLPMLMNGQATVGSPVEKRDIGEVEQELGMVAEDSAKYGKV